MSNLQDDYLIDKLSDYIVQFTRLIEDVAQIMGWEEEEAIRNLVNANWDIRECLNDKDLTTIRDAFERRRDEI